MLPRAWAIAALLVVGVAPVAAQDDEGPDEATLEAYRAAAREGVDAFNAQELDAAREHFERAREILPNPRVHRLLGRVELAQERWLDAARSFHRALTAPDAGHPLSDTLRGDLERDLLPRARAHLIELRVEVRPPEATLTVDGEPADRIGRVLVLEPGTHVVRASAPELEPAERVVDLPAGSVEAFVLELEGAGDEVDAPPSEVTRASGGGGDLVGPGIALIVGGTILGGVGGVVLWLGLDQAAKVEANDYYPDVEDEDERARLMTPSGIAGIATGGALLALGVVLIAIPTGDDGTALLVSPRGLALRGTWP